MLNLNYSTISAVLAFLFVIPGHLCAQAGDGRVSGKVSDPSGALVSEASVSARSAAGKTSTAKTDRSGAFEFRALPPGKYQLSVSAPGFEVSTRDVDVTAGQSQKVDISLAIAKVEARIDVKDEAGRGSTDPANNAGAIVLKEKDLEMYSEDPDELKLQLQRLAGATPGGLSGQIFVDGFGGGRLPPKSAIREIRINQDPFSAEYDQPGFGRIEIFTKPGSAQFHSLFSLRFNHSKFNSTSPFSAPDPAYHTTLFSADFGGPLTSRSSFQFDMDRNGISDSAVIRAQILDPSLNPIQFGQTIPNPKLRTIATFRVDYQVNPRNTLFARYEFYSDKEKNDGLGQFALASQAFDYNKTEHTLQFSNTTIINPKVINESRFEYRQVDDQQRAQNSQPQISVLGAFLGGGSSIGNNSTSQKNYQLQNYTSLDRSKHYFRFGGQVRIATEDDNSTSGFNGMFTFASLTAFRVTQQGLQQSLTPAQIRAAGGGAEQFSIVSGRPSVGNTMFDASAFFQDNWKLRPSVTFSYGLRYETQNEIRDHFDFAPRLGLAMGIHPGKKAAPKTVLRLGFGVFYTRFAQGLALNSLRLNGNNQRQFIVPDPDFFPNIPNPNSLGSSLANPTIYGIDPDLSAPYMMQNSISIERKLPRSTNLAITWLNSRGKRQLLSRNINAPMTGTFSISNPGSGVRPLLNAGDIYRYESRGRFEQNQATVGLRIDGLSRARLSGNYTLNFANSNTSGANSFPSNQFDIDQDYGRANYDVRHQLSFGGQIDLPFGFYTNPLLLITSGQPYNVTAGRDLNGDSIFNDRPTFATDFSRPGVVKTRYGAFDLAPLPGQTIIPPNIATGPGKSVLNLRVAKAFSLGSKEIKSSDTSGAKNDKKQSGSIYKNAWQPMYAIRFELIVNNIFNHTNLATPIGNLSSPFFGKSISLAGSPFSTTAASRQIILRTVFRF
jgi:hypothetical protein